MAGQNSFDQRSRRFRLALPQIVRCNQALRKTTGPGHFERIGDASPATAWGEPSMDCLY